MKICAGVDISKRCPDVCIVPREKFLRFDKADISVAKTNPRRIQDFAQACGRREYVRSQLFMPTPAAIRHNPRIRQLYNRLIANGKKKIVAVIACMRKLLLIMNSMLAKNQC